MSRSVKWSNSDNTEIITFNSGDDDFESETLKWANADNTEVITFDAVSDDEYFFLNEEGKSSYRILKTPVKNTLFNSWEVDGLYDAVLTQPADSVYFKLFKCGFYGYKTGILKDITLYFQDFTSADNGAVDRLVIGYYKGNKEIEILAYADCVETDEQNVSKTFSVIKEHSNNVQITKDIIDDPKNGLLILPVLQTSSNLPAPGTSFSSNASLFNLASRIKPIIGSVLNSTSGEVENVRSIFDAGTQIFGVKIEGNVSSNIAKDTIIKYSATVETNLLMDHTYTNFDAYHMSDDTLNGLYGLKYYAPIFKAKGEVKNYRFSRCYLSHETLSLNNEIDLVGKRIESIQIPIDTGNDWMRDPDKGNHEPSAGSWNVTNNFQIYIAVSEDEPEVDSELWIPADHTYAPKLMNDHRVIWKLTFEKNKVVYNNASGIWIRVKNYDNITDNGKQQIFCETYSIRENPGDILYLHSALKEDEKNVSYAVTPAIRVIFDFDGRAQFMEMLYRKVSAIGS